MSKLREFFAKFIPSLREEVLPSLEEQAETLAKNGFAAVRAAIADLSQAAELEDVLAAGNEADVEMWRELEVMAQERAELARAEAQKLKATAARVADLIGDPLL